MIDDQQVRKTVPFRQRWPVARGLLRPKARCEAREKAAADAPGDLRATAAHEATTVVVTGDCIATERRDEAAPDHAASAADEFEQIGLSPDGPRRSFVGEQVGDKGDMLVLCDDGKGGDGASLGSSLSRPAAIRRRCAIRDVGIPIFRQLWTVEVGASINRATSEVPPSASITVSA